TAPACGGSATGSSLGARSLPASPASLPPCRMVPPAFARACRTLRALPLAIASLAILSAATSAQTLDDGLLAPRRVLRATAEYSTDQWDQYWEGTRKRDNENIGT